MIEYVIFVLVIFGFLFSFLISQYLKYLKGKPEYSCNHDFVTVHTTTTDIDERFLSTCKKCGKQKIHKI